MGLAVILIQISLWVASTTAFFPWEECRADNSCPSTRKRPRGVDVKTEVRSKPPRFTIAEWPLPAVQSRKRRAPRDFSRLSKKYAKNHEPRQNDILSRRDNEYAVLKPIEPTNDDAVGIYQDGNDYAFFVKVELGSEKQPMYMLLDTGAGTTWVMGSQCDKHPCTLHDTFDPDSSETSTHVDSTFTLGYGTGSVGGVNTIDTVQLGSVEMEMEFGVADHISPHFAHFAFDGILGMSLNKGATDNFPLSAKEDGQLKADVFSIYLDRGSDGLNNGELTLGGINEAKFSGEITYTDVSNAGNGDWAIKCDDISLGGKSSGIKGRTSYIDTGTSYVFGPAEDVEAFHNLVKDATRVDSATWTVPCDTKEAMNFTFSGQSYAVLPQDWVSSPDADGVCWSNIYGHEVVADSWLLGAVFLKNVYSVFAFDTTPARIGFARHAEQEVAEEPKTTSSEAPSQTTPPATEEEVGPGIDVGGHETGAPANTGTDESGPVSTESSGEEGKSGTHQVINNVFLAGCLVAVVTTSSFTGLI